MFRKFSPRAVAQEFICLRQQRTTRLDGDRNEVVPSNEVASTRMNRSTLHTLKCGRNTLPKHDEKHPARSRYQSVTLCQQCLCMVFRASGDIARSHFIHNDYCLSFLSCDCVQSSFSGMVALSDSNRPRQYRTIIVPIHRTQVFMSESIRGKRNCSTTDVAVPCQIC